MLYSYFSDRRRLSQVLAAITAVYVLMTHSRGEIEMNKVLGFGLAFTMFALAIALFLQRDNRRRARLIIVAIIITVASSMYLF